MRAAKYDGLLMPEGCLRTHSLPPWQRKILLYLKFRCITPSQESYLVHLLCAKHSYKIYAVQVCLQSQICLYGRINGSIKFMVLRITQYNKFCSDLGIVSEILCPPVLPYSFERTARVVEFGNFWHRSADQSPLEDQDKQKISFFVIRFTVEHSDRLVTTPALKVSTSNFRRFWDLFDCRCSFLRSSCN